MSDLISAAERVIGFERTNDVRDVARTISHRDGTRYVDVSYENGHQISMTFNSVAQARIGANLLKSGSAQEAIASLKRSGGADPLEAGPSYGQGW